MSSDPVATLSVPGHRASRWRFLFILVVFLIGILVGWLLAPRCPPCNSSTAAAGRASGSAASAPVKPERSGSTPNWGTPGGASLHGEPADADQGSGAAREGRGIKVVNGGQGPAGTSGDSSGGSADGSKKNGSAADETAPGPTTGAGRDYKDLPDPPPDQVLTASDFRYDKTDLPRYPQSVTTIGSTLTHPRGATGGFHSTCAIVTSSPFGEVVDWYKAHLPADWHNQVVGDVAALAQQVSIANILKTLTASTQTTGPTSSNASPDASSDNSLSVAMFSPPPNTTGEPTITIKQKAGQSVEITMSKDGANP